MDDNRRNYNEQEGDYFGKRFPQEDYPQRGDNRVASQRQSFDRNSQNGNFINQAPQQRFVNNQNNIPQNFPNQQMQVGQPLPQMQQPQQQIQQGQMMPNFNNPYGYNQNGFQNAMPQNMQPSMGQMPPQMQQMPPQTNGGFYVPSNQFFMQPDNSQKKRNGIFNKGKKTLEEDFNEDMRNVIITYPKTFTDVQSIIDSLRNRQAIIVDLTKINDSTSQRILDYLSGAIYALGGSQQRIADNMFLFTPDGVSIQGPSDLKRKYD